MSLTTTHNLLGLGAARNRSVGLGSDGSTHTRSTATAFGKWRALSDDAAAEAKRRAKRFKLMVDHSPAIIWITDPDCVCTYISRRWYEITGQNKASAANEDWLDYVHPEDRPAITAVQRGLMAARVPFHLEFRLRQADGSWRWMMEAGTPYFEEDGAFAGYVGSMIDIHLQKQTQEEVRRSERRFRDFAEVASDWLWETDASGCFTYVSGRFAELLECDVAACLGRPPWVVCALPASDLIESGWQAFQLDFESRRSMRDLRCMARANGGRLVHFKITGKPVEDESGTFVGYRGTGSDVSREVEVQAEVEFLARHDPLTGLPNRVVFRTRLEQDIARARRHGDGVAVLCIDLDKFKDVNDVYGHAAGDALLQTVATRLGEGLRPDDVAARLGGDEFVLMLYGVQSAEIAMRIAARLVARLSEPCEGQSFDTVVGASIGIALFPEHATDADMLMRRADMALYCAKGEGRGRARVFARGMDQRLEKRRRLELDLKAATATEDGLFLHYQPQFDLKTGLLVGFEALLRWKHPQLGMVSPGDFIPMAEETGIIVPLGVWVLRRACGDAARWPSELTVSVNLSAAHFRQRDLADTIAMVLHQTGLAPERLELEITESVLLQDTSNNMQTLGRIKSMGVRIAMDDFGTGYSSLGYLRNFPFDKIKIDRSFVSELSSRAEADAIVEAVVSLGRNLGIVATAEGVETGAQLDRLRGLGCHHIQGFFCGRPLSVDAILDALNQPSIGSSMIGWINLMQSRALSSAA